MADEVHGPPVDDPQVVAASGIAGEHSVRYREEEGPRVVRNRIHGFAWSQLRLQRPAVDV